MPRKERFARIIGQVNAAGAVEVEDLAARFGCSVETIRRDLRYLEAKGQLLRTYGGALSIQSADVGRSFEKRREEHVRAKEQMAFKASRMIAPGLTVALDGSSSCYFLARALPQVQLKVVTNSMRVLNLLKTNPLYTLIGTGGQIDDKHEDFMLAEGADLHFSEQLHIDLCFISCVGIDLSGGLYDMNDGIARIKAAMMRLSVHTVLLADASKFARKTPFLLGPVSAVDYVVDDGGLKDEHRKRLHELDVNII